MANMTKMPFLTTATTETVTWTIPEWLELSLSNKLFVQSPSPKKDSPLNGDSGDGEDLDDGEELNTKDLAQRISAELKRYSIPQAIFAQRVLCRFVLFVIFKFDGLFACLTRFRWVQIVALIARKEIRRTGAGETRLTN